MLPSDSPLQWVRDESGSLLELVEHIQKAMLLGGILCYFLQWVLLNCWKYGFYEMVDLRSKSFALIWSTISISALNLVKFFLETIL